MLRVLLLEDLCLGVSKMVVILHASTQYFTSLDRRLWDWIWRALESSSTESPLSKTAAAPMPDPATDADIISSVISMMVFFNQHPCGAGV